MSVNNDTAFSGPYAANGVTVTFPFNFIAASKEEVSVYVDSTQLAANLYSVTLQSDGTGSITTTAPLTSGSVVIASTPLFTQTSAFSRTGPYFPDFMNGPLDRAAIRDIALKDGLSRSLKAPPGESIGLLPSLVNRVNKLFTWDGAGKAAAVSVSALAAMLAPLIAALLPEQNKGDPGGNVMSVGSFATLGSLNIPLGTDRIKTSNGAEYEFLPTVTDAKIAANPLTYKRTANGRGFRLDPLQRRNIEFFGGIADGIVKSPNFGGDVYGTDNAAAIEAAIDYERTDILDVEWPFTAKVYFGTGVYDTSRTIQPYGAIHLKGEQASIAAGTVIRFPANVGGVLLNQRNCIRDGGGFGGPFTSAAGSIFEDIHFRGSGTPSETSDAHGFWGRTIASIFRCVFTGFAGSGIAWIGGSNYTDKRYGTPNGFLTIGNTIQQCGGRAQYFASGYDCNGGTSIADVTRNGFSAGFIDVSSLGNTYLNYNVHGSAQINGAEFGPSKSRVWYAGYQWHCITFETVGVAPALGSTRWIRASPQAAASPYWPAYDPSKTYYFQGAFYAGGGPSNVSTVLGYYNESLLYSTHESGVVGISGNAAGTAGSNQLVNINGALVATNGIGGYNRWAGLGMTQMAYLGEYSFAGVGKPFGGTYAHWHHYDSTEDRTYAYYPTLDGDHEYAPGLPGTGAEPIWRVTGRYTVRNFGRASPISAVLVPGRLALRDMSLFDGTGDRLMRMASVVPTTAGGQGEVVWNNGLNPANDAIDYWRYRGSAWVARP